MPVVLVEDSQRNPQRLTTNWILGQCEIEREREGGGQWVGINAPREPQHHLVATDESAAHV